MSRPIEAAIYHQAPPRNRSRACPHTTKIFARWQSGLETPSGCKHWKLRLRLFSESTSDEAFPVDTYRPQDIEKLGIRNATDLTTFLPQEGGGTSNLNMGNGGDGTVQLNLRGILPKETLILIDEFVATQSGQFQLVL